MFLNRLIKLGFSLSHGPEITQKFAKTLKEQLILRFGKVPSASVLANNFNLRAYGTQTISRETARKWLAGLAYPENSRLQVLVQWLGLDANRFIGTQTTITSKDTISAPIERESLFSQAILDALSSQIAVVDDSGQIVQVNAAWRKFALGNQASPELADFAQFNYLAVCENARGTGATQAQQMARGLRAVLNHEQLEYVLKYPCHAPHQKRWFVARVTRMDIQGRGYAIVAHEAVSEKNYERLQFEESPATAD